MNTPNAFILNCVNVPYYAEDRGLSVNHLGSRQINGIAWQIYSVTGTGMMITKWAVRCDRSNFNNVAVPMPQII